jgi:hypothetical protein
MAGLLQRVFVEALMHESPFHTIISFLKLTPSHNTTNANNTTTNNTNHTTTRTILQQEPYYKDTTAIHNNRATMRNNTTTNMSVDKQRPAATFEEALRDVQPRPGLEATLIARHAELQVEAERVRRARQEEEQAAFSPGKTHARSGDGDVAILVLDVAMATLRSAHFIQNSSKLDYFYSLVGANNIENPASSLWFLPVEYSNRLQEALSLFWFWMKQSKCQRAAILFKILVN